MGKGVGAMLSERLKQLRLARGLSLDALAAEIGGLVTKQALSKYEQAKIQPSPRVLTRLASVLGVKATHLWTEPECRIELIAYRKRYSLPKKEQAQVENLVRQTLEERVGLQQLVQQKDPDIVVRGFAVKSLDQAEEAAESLRLRWNLGLDPICSVTDVLENHSVHVIEIKASEKFDGLAAVAYANRKKIVGAAVVSRKRVAGERQRLNLAHELGHLVLRISKNVDQEKAAFRFGGAFLAPASRLHRDVGKKRTNIQSTELFLLKKRYGMSVQALLHRLCDLNVISSSYYRDWCIQINHLGWRKCEPFEMAAERPQWLRRSVLHALSEGMLRQEEAEQFLGESVESKQSLRLVQRRAFMKLPLERRRKIMEAEAERLAREYKRDTEWRELTSGDFTEY